MARFTGATLFVVLLLTAPAFAQMTDSPSTPGNMPESGYHQKEMLATGRITEIDLSKGTVTLDTGTQFTLAPSLANFRARLRPMPEDCSRGATTVTYPSGESAPNAAPARAIA